MYYPPEPIEFSPPYKGVTSGTCSRYVGGTNGSRWNALLSVPEGCSGGGCNRTPGAITAQNPDSGISIAANLGSTNFGESSTRLVIAGASPSTNLTYPAGLSYFGSLTDAQLSTNNGMLRQGQSFQCWPTSRRIALRATQSAFYTSAGPFNSGTGLYEAAGQSVFLGTIEQITSTQSCQVTIFQQCTTSRLRLVGCSQKAGH